MTTSRIIDATTDTNYVIPAITMGEYDNVYYSRTSTSLQINKRKGKIHVGIARKNSEVACLCGQHHKQPKEVWYNPSVEQEPDITCGSCIRVMDSLYFTHTDIMKKIGQKIEEAEFHVAKHRTTATSDISSEITPVPRVVGQPILEVPVAYNRDKDYVQRRAMLCDLNNYITNKYHTYKPLYDHAMKLQAFGFTTSFTDVINDYNRERSNLNAMVTEFNNTINKNKEKSL